ncbi:hypothetical protein EDD63_1111, partial [Breznakia blatticola]
MVTILNIIFTIFIMNLNPRLDNLGGHFILS